MLHPCIIMTAECRYNSLGLSVACKTRSARICCRKCTKKYTPKTKRKHAEPKALALRGIA